MESVHREKILNNINFLMQATDYENFIECCVKKNLLSLTMKENIEEEFGNETDRKLALWRKIPKRGPKAYDKLLEICFEKYPQAYTILNKSIARNLGYMTSVSQSKETYTQLDEPDMKDGMCLSVAKKAPEPTELKPYTGELVNHLNLTVKESTQIHKSSKLDVYKMSSRKRGVLFLINIINFKKKALNRKGANNDRDNLIYLFTKLGFTIYYYEDIEPQEMFNYIEKLQQLDILDQSECFVFGIMTHGNIDDHHTFVEFGNGTTISLDSILEKFYNSNCYALMLKPKIFILPFCRGSHPDQGVYVPNTQHDSALNIGGEGQSSVMKITTKSDILICYATVKGFESHRNTDDGSWYIQALCQVWAENAHDTDVEVMMKMVDTKMRRQWGKLETQTVQTASMENLGFNKALYFNPGYFEDDP